MARSTFYYHAKRLHDTDRYDIARKRISDIYKTNRGRYGYRRVTAQLHNEGIAINHKTVQKLMGQMELKARTKRQKYRSYKGEIGRIAPNVLNRDFHASRPNQNWATDVTQVNIK